MFSRKECFWHFLFFLFILDKGISQNLETVFSRGYNVYVSHLDRFSDGRWLIAVNDSPLPGSIYKDTLSLRIMDSTGVLIRLITLSPPQAFENFSIDHLLILPGDQFMVGYSGGDCDAGGYAHYVEKFDSSGQFSWLIQLDKFIDPDYFGFGLDSNILMISGNDIAKISSDNGTVLWQTEYRDSYVHYMILVPGSEDIIVSDEHGLQYYEQHAIQGNISYTLKTSEEIQLDFGSIGRFQTAGDGIFYAYKFYDKQIIRFRKDLKAKNFLTMTGSFLAMAPTAEGLAILKNKDVNTYQVILYDSLAVKISEHLSEDSGLRPRFIKCFSSGMGLAGSYSSGPNSIYDPDSHYTGRSQGWFRYFPQYNFENAARPASLAITDLIQQSPILYDSVWSEGWDFTGFVHDFSGGQYEIKVTNTGNVPVSHFWINISFDVSVNTWFCSPFNVKQLYFDSEDIQPGESTWVEFGDIEAFHQIHIPDKFCFWTSGNNSIPDYKPQDDVFCMDRIVNTYETFSTTFLVYPNPATEEITLMGFEGEIENIKIYDTNGRLLFHGNSTTIKLNDFPSGYYYAMVLLKNSQVRIVGFVKS